MELTMNSDEVFGLIESIAVTPSKNEKEAMLKKCDSALLRRILKASCDTTITYGVKALPERTMPGAGQFDDGTWLLLSMLAQRQWTGNSARAAIQVEIDRLGEDSSILFKRILLKDLRAGFGENTVNKAFPGMVPDFPYMRCCLPKDTKLSEFPWSEGVISQEKADGMFFNVDHELTGHVFLSSRAGSQFPTDAFGTLIADVQRTFPENTQSHGEVVVERDGVVLTREIGNGILNSVLKGGVFGPGEVPIFFMWDQIPLSAVKPKGKFENPYRTRLILIARQIARGVPNTVRMIPTRIVKSLADAYKHYAELLAAGKEGTVIKNPRAIWRDGTSKDQVKLKLEFVTNLRVTGFEAGKGKNANTFGSMITETSDGLLVVSVSGISDKLRAEIHANRDDWMGSVIAVRANGIMKPSGVGKHSLFLPRFVERRMDKTTEDDLAKVFEREEAAKDAAALINGGAVISPLKEAA